jgi:uncharacterized membrane protein YhhN
MNRASNILAGLAIAAAGQSIAAHVVNCRPFIYFFKPLALLLLLCYAVRNALTTKLPSSRWISIGLAFSLCGDVFLMWPDRFFPHGLLAFLLAHISYLIAFTRGIKFPANWVALVGFFGFAAADYFSLHSNLPHGLVLPVAIYSLVLSAMAAQALGRYLLLRASAEKLAAIGAIFFVISDSLLGFDRFHTAIPLAPVLILIPYYAAQFLIALSTRPGNS